MTGHFVLCHQWESILNTSINLGKAMGKLLRKVGPSVDVGVWRASESVLGLTPEKCTMSTKKHLSGRLR